MEEANFFCFRMDFGGGLGSLKDFAELFWRMDSLEFRLEKPWGGIWFLISKFQSDWKFEISFEPTRKNNALFFFSMKQWELPGGEIVRAHLFLGCWD